MCNPQDTGNLPPMCCWHSYLDGRIAGYAEGLVEGRRQVEAELWEDAAVAVRNAAHSIDVMRARERARARWSA